MARNTSSFIRAPRGARGAALALIALAGIASRAGAQTGVVTASVSDRTTGQPLEAVRVQVGTSPLGGTTDVRGRVVIRNVPVGEQTLRVTRIGYRPESPTITVRDRDTTRVSVALSASAVELQQVVVTGTGGAVEKRKVGASLATVDVAQLSEQIPTSNLQTLLAAKVPGLRSASVGGGVGEGQDLRIRGISSFSLNQRPAIYIDGVRVDSRGTEWAPPYGSIACCFFSGGNTVDRLSDLNPSDIDRIEVLKGAAAATLYGSEATNGVIQIFTKRGRGSEQRAQWDVGLGTGFNRLRENLPTTLFPRFVGPDGTRARDANGLITNGPYQSADISASGGARFGTYFASGMISKEEGSIKPNDQLKGSMRLNVSMIPTDRWTVELRSSYMRDRIHLNQAGNNWTSLLGNAMNGDPRTATKDRPYGEAWVPVRDIQRMLTESDADRWTGGITASYQMTPSFTHRVIVGLDAVSDQKQRFFPFDGAFGPAYVTNGQKNTGIRTYRTYTVDYLGQLAFHLPFRIESNLSFGGQGFWENERLEMGVGNNFPGPGVSTISSAALTNAIESYAETINLGFLAQNRFAWRDRLFSTVGIRIDGNSAFGKNYGFKRYPKIDLSYDLSKDGILPSWLSALRLRGAIGKAGKMPGPFDSFTSFAPSPVFKDQSGIVPFNPGNADLRPESSTEREVGFEAGLWQDRIGVEASYYRQTTRDAIVAKSNPPSQGFSDPKKVNVGAIENRGWEASINYLILSRQSVTWTANVRLDGNKNKVTSLGGLNLGAPGPFGENIVVGYPIRGIWEQVPTGFSVVNGKPVTTRSDTAVFFGPPLPTFNAAYGSTLRWGAFQLYGLVSMERGAWFGNTDRSYRIRQGGADEYLKLLGPKGEKTFAADSAFQWHSILNAVDSRDNVRLKEISLAWRLPTRLTDRLAVGATTLTVSGLNLMWWDHCHCVDPNMNWNGADSFNVNNGFLAQPSPRQFRLQLRAKF